MKNSSNNPSLQKDLKDLSFYLGSNLDWIQGAGGNTSVKEGGVLWVKASGFWLSDAKHKDMFTPLDRATVLDKIVNKIEDLSSAIITDKKDTILKPSIESTLHALMPHRFVAHVHSVNVISYAVLKYGKKILSQKLKGIKWLWVPYVRPGLPLTMMLEKMNLADFDVAIFANHGLVIGGDSKEEVLKIFSKVERRLSRPVRSDFSKLDKVKLEGLVEAIGYRLPKHDLTHLLAKDRLSIEIIGKRALYPDHVIFLGPGSIAIMTEEEFVSKSSQKLVNFNYKAVVVKGIGLVVNKKITENSEEMLHCLTNVFLRLNSDDKLQHLTKKQEADLLGWDAEKYRKLIQR